MNNIQKNSIKIYGVLSKHFQTKPIIYTNKTQRVVYSRKNSNRKYRLFLGEYEDQVCIIYSDRGSRTSDFIINYLKLPSIFYNGKFDKLIPHLKPHELLIKDTQVSTSNPIFEGVIPFGVKEFRWINVDIEKNYPEFSY